MAEEEEVQVNPEATPDLAEFIATLEEVPEGSAQSSAGGGAPGHDFGAAMFQTGLSGIFAMMARGRGSHWKLTTEEAEGGGAAIAGVVAHYWPDFDPGPLLMLGVVSVGIVGPRLAKDAELRDKAEEQEKASKARAPGCFNVKSNDEDAAPELDGQLMPRQSGAFTTGG